MTQTPIFIPQPEEVATRFLTTLGAPKIVDNVSSLLSDSTLAYTPSLKQSDIVKPLVEAGTTIQTRDEGFLFVVAADDATDHDVATAGGVKLYARPDANGVIDVRQFGCVAGQDSAVQLQKALSHPNLKINIPRLDDPFIVQASLTCAVNEKQILGGWIKEKTGVTLEPMVTVSGDKVTIDGLKIEGAQTTAGSLPADQNKAAVLITGDNCAVINCTGSGKTTMVRTNGNKSRIAFNDFTGFGEGFTSAQNQLLSIRGEYHTIIGNQLHNCGAGITCGSTVLSATISGNVVSGTRDNAIYVSSGVNCVVANNSTFDTFGASAIKVRGFGNVVSGNVVRNHSGGQGNPAITMTSIAVAYANSQETYFVEFNSGSVALRAGQVLTGATSGATGTVQNVWIKDGSLEEGDASGFIVFYVRNATAFAVGENLSLTGGSADVATVLGVPRIGANGNICTNNAVDRCGGYGIWITFDADGSNTAYRQQGAICNNNTVTNCGLDSLEIFAGPSGGIAMTSMFNCECIGNTVIGTAPGSLGGLVFNLSENFDIAHNTVIGQLPAAYVISSSSLRFSHNTLRGGTIAVRLTTNASPGLSDGISFDHNTIYGNVVTEQGNFTFSDGNVLYGAIIAVSKKLATQDYFDIQRNTLIRPDVNNPGISITMLGQATKPVGRVLITDNNFDCSIDAIRLALDGTSVTNLPIKLVDLSRNTIVANTTVAAVRIFTGAYLFAIERMIIDGGSCVNRRAFLEATCVKSGRLTLHGYRADSTDSGTNTLCTVDGFETISIDNCDFGDSTIPNGPLVINCDGKLFVSQSTFRNMSSAGIDPGSDITELHWRFNEVKGTTSDDVQSQLAGSTTLISSDMLRMKETSAEPPDPPNGYAIQWYDMSTGDIRIKSNFTGLVKSRIIFDHSETTFTVLPEITGTAFPGETLTCSSGTATGATGYAYQWFVNDLMVIGANTNEYEPSGLEIGLPIKCRVTATIPSGTDPIMTVPVACWHPIDDVVGGIVYLANKKVYSSLSPDTLAVNSARVRQWSDHTDSFRAVNVADDVTKPRFFPNAVLGNAVVQFDGQDENLSMADGSQAYFRNKSYGYIIAAIKDTAHTTGNDFHRVVHWPTNGTNPRFDISTRHNGTSNFSINARRLDADTTVSASSASDGDWNVITGEALWADGTLNLRVNGTQTATTSFASSGATSNTLSSAVRMGNGHPSAPAAFFPGQIACVFAYDDELTAAELSRLERYAGLLVGKDIPLV